MYAKFEFNVAKNAEEKQIVFELLQENILSKKLPNTLNAEITSYAFYWFTNYLIGKLFNEIQYTGI